MTGVLPARFGPHETEAIQGYTGLQQSPGSQPKTFPGRILTLNLSEQTRSRCFAELKYWCLKLNKNDVILKEGLGGSGSYIFGTWEINKIHEEENQFVHKKENRFVKEKENNFEPKKEHQLVHEEEYLFVHQERFIR